MRGGKGVSEELTNLKKGMYENVRREKNKNVKKIHKNVSREGEGQKLVKIYLKWINFCMNKILRTATLVDFCVV